MRDRYKVTIYYRIEWEHQAAACVLGLYRFNVMPFRGLCDLTVDLENESLMGQSSQLCQRDAISVRVTH